MGKQKMDPARRRRIGLGSIAFVLGLAFALPLASYSIHWLGGQAIAQDASSNAAPDIAAGGIEGGRNPRSNYWRAVGEGVEGYSAIKGPGANVLVERSGTYWQQFREGTIAKYLPWAIVAMVAILLLYHLIHGRNKLDRPLSGRRIKRWGWLDRLVHWTVAISFVALAITGLSMLIGRELLIPVLGKEGFALWAQTSLMIHNYLGPVFSVGIGLMILMWVWYNFPARHDWTWLKMGGGLFGKNKQHPPAGRMNAGEKLWFWLLATGGVVVALSGLVLVAPSYGITLPFLDDVRAQMQQANLVHAALAVLWTAVALGHIYIGTAGTEGAFEGMATGYVSEEWAEQHHDIWHAKMVQKGKVVEPVGPDSTGAGVRRDASTGRTATAG